MIGIGVDLVVVELMRDVASCVVLVGRGGGEKGADVQVAAVTSSKGCGSRFAIVVAMLVLAAAAATVA